MPVLNISCYKFITLDDRTTLRETLLAECLSRQLKGTILLAPEGINIFLAGEAEAVRGWISMLHQDPRFADIAPKESWSETTPFKRMRVRLKKEIITMKVSDIRPEAHRAETISPAKLKKWLDRGQDDQGREVVMIDTRNVYEVENGTFINALDFGIDRFSQYPEHIAAHKDDFANKTVVTFCTGGIRCEKAVLYMNKIGMAHVYQLDGGILKYFEEVGGAHWTGNCVVFDHRSELDPGLRPAQEPLTHR